MNGSHEEEQEKTEKRRMEKENRKSTETPLFHSYLLKEIRQIMQQ